jgi:octaprenyl-diphosphate synthase
MTRSIMAARPPKLGKNVGDDFREGKITLPVVLSFRRGNARSARSGRRARKGEATKPISNTPMALMTRHRALEDTIKRAQHYGAMAKDALALFPASNIKQALEEAVDFCIARTH